jgi:two-component system, NarL family, response regulator FusR
MINVALIDDHNVVRSGFTQLLSLEKDILIIGEYGSAAEAWAGLPTIDVHVVIMDISLPDENGLSLLKRLRQKMPDFRAIILSIYDTTACVQSAMTIGARGYLTKRCGPDELVQALRIVSSGGLYLCPDAQRALRHIPQHLETLTPREKEVFQLLINGSSVKSIGEQLSLSHKTVHVHRANILVKLQCETTVELVHFALQHQLFTDN